MTDEWKVDLKYSFGVSLFRDGREVASDMEEEDAELIAHSMNHYRSVVSALKRIHFQIHSQDTISDSEANKLLCNIELAAFVTLGHIGEKV